MEENIVMNRFCISLLFAALLFSVSCRQITPVTPSTDTNVTDGQKGGSVKGFFLLNEGNMGNNKATLDYFDYESGSYTKNIYSERNPDVALELGDVGNDLKIYGAKLYAAINCSNFIEVMDLSSAKHVAEIPLPNCRYIAFKGQYLYVSSYAGAVEADPKARKGYVAKIDTLSFKQVDSCTVGYQPEEMVIVGDRLFVANSGGYMAPDYDDRVFIIDINTMEAVDTITVAKNLHRMEYDGENTIYVSSRGDYYGSESGTYKIDARTLQVEEIPLLPNSNMVLKGDSLFVLSNEWSHISQTKEISYAIYDASLSKVVSRSFITDGTEGEIRTPFGIAVNPETNEIFITDATDYVTPGVLHCYTMDGVRKWSVTTGDIPAHFAFTRTRLENL